MTTRNKGGIAKLIANQIANAPELKKKKSEQHGFFVLLKDDQITRFNNLKNSVVDDKGRAPTYRVLFLAMLALFEENPNLVEKLKEHLYQTTNS